MATLRVIIEMEMEDDEAQAWREDLLRDPSSLGELDPVSEELTVEITD